MKPFSIIIATILTFATASFIATAADAQDGKKKPAVQKQKRFPNHWGDPPRIQTRDFRLLPGGYGRGSSTLAKWIQKNLDNDARAATAGGGKKVVVKKGWVPLFNGKNLNDFEIKSGTATYELKDGAIVGTTKPGSPNTFLCTKKKYGDFDLTFEVKCHDSLNSGVQIRSKLKGDKFGGRVNGPQIEIEASGSNGAEAGYIYGEAAGGWLTPKERLKPHKHFKDGEWNKYRVLAEGPRIRTWINDQPVEDLTHEGIYKTHPKGLIGLQVHGVGNRGPFTVAWRNLMIHEIMKTK